MLTIRQLFSNITKGQAAVPTKYIYQELDKFYLSIKSTIQIPKAELKDNGTIIYFKVPSSSSKALYDIVLWVKTKTKIKLDTAIKLYSNSPNFGFSFAYLYHKNDSLLFPEYYPKKMITDAPNVRNPIKSISFDKHTYAILKHLSKIDLSQLVKSTKTISNKVATFKEKQKESSK